MNITIPSALRDAKVSNLLDSNGAWNWALLNHWVPEDILDKIASILPPEDEEGADSCNIIVANAGQFSIAAMIELIGRKFGI